MSRACPKCGCGSISREREPMRGALTGDLECNDCGYTGMPEEFENNDAPPQHFRGSTPYKVACRAGRVRR